MREGQQALGRAPIWKAGRLGRRSRCSAIRLGGSLRESKGVVTKKLMEYGKPTLAVRFTPEIQGGESGGPILNDRGEVVSVLSRAVVTRT